MNYFLRIAEHLGPGGNGEVEEARKMLRGVVQPGSRFGLIMKTADIDFKFVSASLGLGLVVGGILVVLDATLWMEK